MRVVWRGGGRWLIRVNVNLFAELCGLIASHDWYGVYVHPLSQQQHFSHLGSSSSSSRPSFFFCPSASPLPPLRAPSWWDQVPLLGYPLRDLAQDSRAIRFLGSVSVRLLTQNNVVFTSAPFIDVLWISSPPTSPYIVVSHIRSRPVHVTPLRTTTSSMLDSRC